MMREVRYSTEVSEFTVRIQDAPEHADEIISDFLQKIGALADEYTAAASAMAADGDLSEPRIKAAAAMVLKCEALIECARSCVHRVQPLLSEELTPADVAFAEFEA